MATLLYPDESLVVVPVLGESTVAPAGGVKAGGGYDAATSADFVPLPETISLAAFQSPECGCLRETYLEFDVKVCCEGATVGDPICSSRAPTVRPS